MWSVVGAYPVKDDIEDEVKLLKRLVYGLLQRLDELEQGMVANVPSTTRSTTTTPSPPPTTGNPSIFLPGAVAKEMSRKRDAELARALEQYKQQARKHTFSIWSRALGEAGLRKR